MTNPPGERSLSCGSIAFPARWCLLFIHIEEAVLDWKQTVEDSGISRQAASALVVSPELGNPHTRLIAN